MRFLIQRFADPVVIWRWITGEDSEYLYSSSDDISTDPYWALVFSDTPDQVSKTDVIVVIHGLEGSYVAAGDPNPYIESDIDGSTERSRVSTITYSGTVADIGQVYTDQDIQGVVFNTQDGNYVFSVNKKLRKAPVVITEFGFMSREDKNILDAVPATYSTKTETISRTDNEEYGIRLYNASNEPVGFIPVMISTPRLSEGVIVYDILESPIESTVGITVYRSYDFYQVPNQEDIAGWNNEVPNQLSEKIYVKNSTGNTIVLRLEGAE